MSWLGMLITECSAESEDCRSRLFYTSNVLHCDVWKQNDSKKASFVEVETTH